MEQAEKEIITGVLSTLYQLDATGIEPLFDGDKLKPEALQTITALDADRVKKLKESAQPDPTLLTGKFQEGYKKAKAEERGVYEKEIADKFQVKTEKKGLDLINEIIAKQTAGTELTEDKVKTHPVYVSLADSIEKVKSDAKQEADRRIAELEASNNRARVFGQVTKDGLAILDTFKPVISANPIVAKNQKQRFVDGLEQYDYVPDASVTGGYIIKHKDGKPAEDKHGHPLKFPDLAKIIATENYDLEAAESKGAPADPNKVGDKGGAGDDNTKYTLKKPTSENEYIKMVSEINALSIDVKERIKLKDQLRTLYQGTGA